jgi:hypothetical protein
MIHRLSVLLLVAVVLAGCTASPSQPRSEAPRSATPPSPTSAGPSPDAVVHTSDPYIGLAAMLHARHVRVWWETDLVARWLEGPTAFDTAVARLGRLAQVPGTVGFKVADELGYGDGLRSPDDAARFLTDAHRALARVAPGKRLLVDAIVPELGCLPWRSDAQSCVDAARRDYPAATVDAMTRYLRSGALDNLDLSTGLLDASFYASRGLTVRQAQQEAWAHVVSWGWGRFTTLQARKALAAAGGYQGSAANADDDTAVYVDVPVASGAKAVDIWTWRQSYDGQTVSLLNAGLADNPLWTSLVRLHGSGVHLFTHMTPSQLPTAPAAYAHECDLAAAAFTDVFVAAGTG